MVPNHQSAYNGYEGPLTAPLSIAPPLAPHQWLPSGPGRPTPHRPHGAVESWTSLAVEPQQPGEYVVLFLNQMRANQDNFHGDVFFLCYFTAIYPSNHGGNDRYELQ